MNFLDDKNYAKIYGDAKFFDDAINFDEDLKSLLAEFGTGIDEQFAKEAVIATYKIIPK